MVIKVRCIFVIPVEVPDDPDYDAHWDIEVNHCPATGRVGEALDEIIESYDAKGLCWGCTFGGTCEIVEDNDDPQ